MKILVTFAVIATLATGAFAHSRVDGTVPQNGAIVAEAPAEISLSFAKKIRLTRVDLRFEDHPSERLDLAGQVKFDRKFVLSLTGKGQGTYRIEWRGLGADGHAMQGNFAFEVK